MKLIRKDIFKLTIPILAEQAFMTLMGMVNTIMAGHIGKEAVSAVGMVDSLNNIIIAFFSALAVGGTVVVAQYSGKNNIKKVNETVKQSLFSGGLIGVLVTIIIWIFRKSMIIGLYGSAEQTVIDSACVYLGISVFTYPLIAIMLVASGVLRGVGDTKNPMKITMFMNCINVVLSYIFIYGVDINIGLIKIDYSGIGIVGAALGIAIARAIGSMLIFIVLLRGSRAIKLRRLKNFRFNKELLRPIFSIGIPASLESLIFNGGKLITQIFIVGMGTVAIASNSIATSVAGFVNMIGIAFSIAATTIVGRYMGKGESKQAENALKYLTLFSSVCLLIVGVISVLTASNIAGVYTVDSDVIKLTAKIVVSHGLIVAIWPFSFILPAGLKGAGDAKYTLVTTLIGMWLFRISLGYILGIPLRMGLFGVWIAMYIDWIVRGTLYIIRFKSGKWKQKIVIKSV